jgi:D-alanyl-D-alanine endopeptidase (penicillin-binding protein 7)
MNKYSQISVSPVEKCSLPLALDLPTTTFLYGVKIFFLSLSLLLLSAFFSFVQAEEIEAEIVNPEYYINLDKETIAKGYTVSAFENSLKLSLVPGILDESTGVLIKELQEEMPTPWSLDKISKIYQFEFLNKQAYDNHKPFYIQFSYEEESDYYKQVYFYDKNFSTWRPLPTKDFPEEKFVRSLIHLPFARLAVFSNPDVMTLGRASWYAYKGGDFAASPDVPKDSVLRVYNNDNDKFVDVVVNDFGPERHIFPDRAIDLDKVAFSKIASLGEGVIDIRVEPLKIIPDSNGNILGIEDKGVEINPIISSKSAIVLDEESEEILFEKNATSTLPIASLTKLVAISVFLNTKPSLNDTVIYSVKDEEYNYEYCEKWESARIRLNEGDEITLEDLVYASLVGSANNAIETLVRASGMSREDFIKKMNEMVLEWGAENTNFIEPTGLSPDNVSSAFDYAIITKKVFINPIIIKASSMDQYSFKTLNTERDFKINNTNKLIKTLKYNFEGSKTGYLHEALYCLMSRVKLNNGKYGIVVILGSDTRDLSFHEMDKLIKFAERKIGL